MGLHDHIRNALHLVMPEVGLMTGLYYTREDIQKQCRELLSCFPLKPPLNVR